MGMGMYYDDEWDALYGMGNDNLKTVFEELCSDTLSDKIKVTIDMLKVVPINGCITGSCLLEDVDFDQWDTCPDIDVFVYSRDELMHAIDIMQYKLGMEPGTGSDRSCQQEMKKIEWLRDSGPSKKIPVTTHKFFCDGIIVNITLKKNCYSLITVLSTFDMSIIMKGYDIKNHYYLDLRAGDPKVATPNMMRSFDVAQWNVAKWIRQFDRVVKYYARGFDTRPMAEFYLKLIDDCIEVGNIFDTKASIESFESFAAEFIEKRKMISDWLDEHKED